MQMNERMLFIEWMPIKEFWKLWSTIEIEGVTFISCWVSGWKKRFYREQYPAKFVLSLFKENNQSTVFYLKIEKDPGSKMWGKSGFSDRLLSVWQMSL